MTTTKTIATAEPSIAPPPLKRHIVDNGDWAKGVMSPEAAALHGKPTRVFDGPDPQQKTLCGEPWDRYGISPSGPLCGACRAEYVRRHPTWPLPGGAK